MGVTREHISSSTPMGATLIDDGATFRVWAPRAQEVYLVGSFADETLWAPRTDHLLQRGQDGHWTGFRRGVLDGTHYKFWIVGTGSQGFKRDPYARELSSVPAYPNCNCLVRNPDSYSWRARDWRSPEFSDLILYQLHIGTFAGQPLQRPGCFLDVIGRLDYLRDLGVTGLQLLPIVEFASPRSLGYDGSDLFSPEMDYTVEGAEARSYLDIVNRQLANAGAAPVTPAEIEVPINQFKLLVDLCHLKGIAVLLDVVYNHAGFQVGGQDESLYFFDRAAGSSPNDSLYFMDRSHTGPVFAFWNEGVRQFLIDNAAFFVREYRIDGLRFDQTSVIDTEARGSGWQFLQDCTGTVRATNPRVCQVAEYWPRNPFVTESTGVGGAGFDATWSDGQREAIRSIIGSAAHGRDAFVDLDRVATELANPGFRDGWRAVNYVESHDQVYRDRDPRIALLADSSNPRSWYARSRARVAAGLVMTTPGIPMLFMGQEILEDKQWCDDPANHPGTLVWWEGLSQGEKPMVDMHRYVRDLIGLRRRFDALHQGHIRVFHVDTNERVLALHRWVEGRGEDVVVIVCLNEQTRYDYRVGLPRSGRWRELFNSDVYDSWVNPQVAGNGGTIEALDVQWQGFDQSAQLVLPANAIIVLAPRVS